MIAQDHFNESDRFKLAGLRGGEIALLQAAYHLLVQWREEVLCAAHGAVASRRQPA